MLKAVFNAFLHSVCNIQCITCYKHHQQRQLVENHLNGFPNVSMSKLSELSNSSHLATPTYFQLYWEKRLERAPKNVLGDSLFREEIRRTTPPPSRKGGGELYKPTTKPPPPHHRRTPAMGQHSHYNSCILILYSCLNIIVLCNDQL